jgi:hypothetical protein
MGIFRRHEPSQLEQALGGRILQTGQRKDVFVIRTGKDGLVRETCWFCGGELEFDPRNPTSEAATVMIEPMGEGEPIHGVCHRACADRAKGSLAF